MGNNASSTRKSGAVPRHTGPVRKSYQSQSNHHNLEEEFSDLILHEVKRQKQERALDRSQSPETPVLAHRNAAAKDRFTDDLIEDEFNELNHGILDRDEELLRNILPVTTSDDDAMQVDGYDAASMGSSDPEDSSKDPSKDISKVDFTQASLPAVARQPQSINASSYVGHPVGNVANAANAAGAPYNGLVPVRVKWVNQTREAVDKVAVIGSFSNWRDVIKLKRSRSNPQEYHTTIRLPLGVHKLLYVVNSEYRVSEWLPTATDQEGIFFNWFEVLDPQHLFNNAGNHVKVGPGSTDEVNLVQTAGEHDASQIQKKSNSFLMKISRSEKGTQPEHVEYLEAAADYTYISSQDSLQAPSQTPSQNPSYLLLLDQPDPANAPLTYSSDIPEMLVDYNYFKSKDPDYELPEPPQLPAHLNNVLLNKMSAQHQPPPPPPQSLALSQPGGGFPKRPTLRRAESSYYASSKELYHRSIPNHVILNHLMTTLIRNDVLTVACITRYSGKFVTQIMHSPAE